MRKMELSQVEPCQDDSSDFKTPAKGLVRFFKKSRDNWKRKYMDTKREIKRFKNQASDMRKSREMWKERSKELQARANQLERELSDLKEMVAAEQESLLKTSKAMPAMLH